MKRVFVDANVINDIYDANRPLHEASYQCLEYCMQQAIELLARCDLVTTIYYITAKTQGRGKALEVLDQIQKDRYDGGTLNRFLPINLKTMPYIRP